MKQMIKEVVDDVIRSTITQVISERSVPSDSDSSGGDKPLPSVKTMDKEEEQENKEEKDLLLLLKSPDVHVKHFPSEENYESIRFDREHLDPKSCLGFANLPVLEQEIKLNQVDLSELTQYKRVFLNLFFLNFN